MSAKTVKTLQAFTTRNAETGELLSYEFGQLYEVDSDVASAWASAGLAEEYEGEVAKPYGKITITDTEVTDCAAYATAQVVDAKLVAGNIKKDVTILGVTGTYEA